MSLVSRLLDQFVMLLIIYSSFATLPIGVHVTFEFYVLSIRDPHPVVAAPGKKKHEHKVEVFHGVLAHLRGRLFSPRTLLRDTSFFHKLK